MEAVREIKLYKRTRFDRLLGSCLRVLGGSMVPPPSMQTKDLNRHFTKEDIQTVEKHVKRRVHH